MYLHQPLSAAADNIATVVRGVRPEQMSAATPCADFDTRQLVNHLLSWSPVIEGAALRSELPAKPPGPWSPDVTRGDWQADYLSWLDRIVRAWEPESAWEGNTDVGFAVAPAAVIGAKSVCEFVVHGWDLARATGQPFECDEELAKTAYDLVLDTAEETRRGGMYGPAVVVSDSASALDRALALSGRNPNWAP